MQPQKGQLLADCFLTRPWPDGLGVLFVRQPANVDCSACSLPMGPIQVHHRQVLIQVRSLTNQAGRWNGGQREHSMLPQVQAVLTQVLAVVVQNR